MNISRVIVLAALAASATALAQRSGADRAFTATGTSCEDVTWSEEALAQYPNIATACREVMERDGRYYVRFEGEVRRVSAGGREMTIDFEDGDRLTVTPPENLSVYMDGRKTRVRDLRPGDRLNFYIPQNQLVATFFAGEPETAPAEEAPITPAPEETYAAELDREELPAAGSLLPLAGFAGLLLIGVGAALTLYRRM